MRKRLKVDKDDIPLLVQNMVYRVGDMTLEVTFFNGMIRIFCIESLTDVGLNQTMLTRLQKLEAEQGINAFAKLYFNEWVEQDIVTKAKSNSLPIHLSQYEDVDITDPRNLN